MKDIKNITIRCNEHLEAIEEAIKTARLLELTSTKEAINGALKAGQEVYEFFTLRDARYSVQVARK